MGNAVTGVGLPALTDEQIELAAQKAAGMDGTDRVLFYMSGWLQGVSFDETERIKTRVIELEGANG